MADFSFSDEANIKELNQNVLNDPENFEHWEKLVRAVEGQEQGLHRGSSPGAITAMRQVYDGFLARFPLFFGYWKKYADLEFNIGGTEAAESVYERGVASIGVSVDLWAHFCTFKVDTCHEPDLIRELYERAAESIGLDFMSHLFWDKYIEWEERNENPTGIFKIYCRLSQIPLHQYARYYEKFSRMAASRPIDELATPEIISSFKQAVESEGVLQGADMEAELRNRLITYHTESFQRLANEVNERWEYESAIKRPYYHVTELDDAQIANWNRYLDFEEKHGNYERIKFLYERCLVTAANYEDFWFRYVRWMTAQPGKTEEVRNIYQRACCLYVPISQPRIRLLYAAFEESIDQPSKAADVHEAILDRLPNHTETIVSLANLHNRHHGIQAALAILARHIDSQETTSDVRGACVEEAARITYEYSGDAEAARKVWQERREQCLDSESFWLSWFNFEFHQPTSKDKQAGRHLVIKGVFDDVKQGSRLEPEAMMNLTKAYQKYLQQHGGTDAMKEYVQLDQEMHGPAGLQGSVKAKAMSGKPLSVQTGAENGQASSYG